MVFENPRLLFQVLYPLLLVPGLIWIGYRYLPVLAGAGRLRLYLLMALCGAALAVQVGGIATRAYPLVTWTMYSAPHPLAESWRLVAVGPEGERPFPVRAVASTRSRRAFVANFTRLALQARSEGRDTTRAGVREEPGMGNALESPGASGTESTAFDELARLLERMLQIHNSRAGPNVLHELRIEECAVDVRRVQGGNLVACSPFLSVPIPSGKRQEDTPDAP